MFWRSIWMFVGTYFFHAACVIIYVRMHLFVFVPFRFFPSLFHIFSFPFQPIIISILLEVTTIVVSTEYHINLERQTILELSRSCYKICSRRHKRANVLASSRKRHEVLWCDLTAYRDSSIPNKPLSFVLALCNFVNCIQPSYFP
jgi:hypothetical protein